MIERAGSGHPDTPLGMAPVACTLWQRYLRFDPTEPIWPNRDLYVLPEGHASALLWSLLHLAGPRSRLEALKTFRLLGSKCPGHPEYRTTSGVETTSGPPGQGVATSAGIAMAGQWLAARYNREGFPLFDFNAYALAGDGCMMEHLRRGGLAGRPPGTEHCAGSTIPTGSRSKGTPAPPSPTTWRPLPRLRLERHHRRRRQQPRPGRPGTARLPSRARASHPGPGAQPHRISRSAAPRPGRCKQAGDHGGAEAGGRRGQRAGQAVTDGDGDGCGAGSGHHDPRSLGRWLRRDHLVGGGG